jgi:hypothetical protein
MEKFQSLSAHCLLFDLAARLGSLEGYLYAEEKVDTSYLPNWLRNIELEFQSLATEVKSEIRPDYLALLKKVRDLLHKSYGEQDANSRTVEAMIFRVSHS